MSWNFQEDDLRQEIAELNNKLAVQGVKLGDRETKLLKAEGELGSLRESYEEAMRKLREEADRALHFESTLLKAQEDLVREKVMRENVEKTLRTSEEERKKNASSVRETEYLMDRLATESNQSSSKVEQYAKEKMKLEAQVRELQAELSRKQMTPVAPAKTSRRRSSSLTNINRVAVLERDMESLRASASSTQIEAETVKEKLSKAKTDLVRLENEKGAMEKRVKDMEASLRNAIEEKDELQREIEFYRNQNNSSREDDLMARLEHEESKVALLESQLAQMSRTRAMKGSVDRLTAQLKDEVSKREAAETREIELTGEREEALNELHELQRSFEVIQRQLSSKDNRIRELENQARALQEQSANLSRYPPSSPLRIDEQKVDELLTAIGRLREERDDLKASLEFAQMEAHFEIESLRKQLTEKNSETVARGGSQSSLAKSLVERVAQIKSLRTSLSAFIVTVQYLEEQNSSLGEQLSVISQSEADLRASAAREVSSLQARLVEQENERFRLTMEIASLEEQSQHGVENLQHDLCELRKALSSKQEELAYAQLSLKDESNALAEERERRETLEGQVRNLEVDANTIRQQLADALDNCERLEVRQASDMTADAVTKSLKAEVEELKARVLRRTEQIGLQQHDIKRLETNLRLTEETLEEIRNDLELSRTENEAMLEDCSTSRSERDEAQRALVISETEVERLTGLIEEHAQEVTSLKEVLSSLTDKAETDEHMKSTEITALKSLLDERDRNEAVLSERLASTKAALLDVQNKVNVLSSELAEARDISQKMAETDKHRSTTGDSALQIRDAEINKLREELAVSKAEHEELQQSLRDAEHRYETAIKELEQAHSEMEAVSQGRHAIESSKDDEITQLAAELSDSKAALAKAQEELQTSEYELEKRSQELTCALENVALSRRDVEEVSRLRDEIADLNCKLETVTAERETLASTVQLKSGSLADTQEMLTTLEEEKANLVSRLERFEGDASTENSELSALREAREEQQRCNEAIIKELESKIESLEEQSHLVSSQSATTVQSLSAERDSILTELEAAKKELDEQRSAYESLVSEHTSSTASRNAEVADLHSQLAGLKSKVDELTTALEKETAAHTQDVEAREAELKAVQDAQGSSSAESEELTQKIKDYRDQLKAIRSELMSVQDENTSLQSELDEVNADRHRVNLQLQSLEHQLEVRDKSISDLHGEMNRIKEMLSQSERTGKVAEMNLLLMGQQHERTIASLRAQLKEHEKDGERIHKLQQIVGEMREQVSEMESCLRAKNAEIEENDDKFIQILKEKKKLTSKVETLTKRNNNLQSKLAAAGTQPQPVVEAPALKASTSADVPRQTIYEKDTHVRTSFASRPSADAQIGETTASSSKPRLSSRPSLPQDVARDPSRRLSNKRPRMTPPPLDEIPTTTYIGQKRRLPDDIDTEPALVEARLPDSAPLRQASPPSLREQENNTAPPVFAESLTSTPRHRRPMQALRSGFTPVRSQNVLRSAQPQPSPIRKSSAARDLHAPVISDVTNSPPKPRRAFTAEVDPVAPRSKPCSSRGWLDKLQSKGANNPLSRARQR